MGKAAVQRVGLIGLGLMGRGMGLSLLRAGFTLGVVAHRQRQTVDELVAAGAWEATTPAALAQQCDTLVCCLPSADAAQAVLLGGADAAGVLAGAAPGLLVVECSTLLPTFAVQMAARLADAGVAWVDAPVTRGPTEALAGRLNALVGGTPEAVARATPVLQAFCERQFSFGAVGQGYAAKLISNFLAFNNLVAIAEAMASASRAGLDLPRLLDAIAVSGGQNRVLDGLAPLLTGTGPSRSRVTLATAYKDVDSYRQFARSLHTAGPVADGVVERLAAALAAGLGAQLTPEYLRFVAEA